MKFFVKAKPNSKEAKIKKIGETSFEIQVKEPAQEGKANAAVIKALAEHLKIPKSRLEIVLGKNSKQKVIELN